MNLLTKSKPQIQYKVWAGIGHEGQTLDDLIGKMKELGNTIVAVDEENQRVLVAHKDETQDRWGCTICIVRGYVTICDTQDELGAHLDHAHPGWTVNAKGEPHVG